MKKNEFDLEIEMFNVDFKQILSSKDLNDIVERYYFATMRLKEIFKYRVDELVEENNHGRD